MHNPTRRPASSSPRLLGWLAVALAALWTFGPLWMAVALSVKPQTEFYRATFFPFLDFAPTLDHWRIEYLTFWLGSGMGLSLLNSAFVGATSALLALALGGAAAFSVLRRPPRRFWAILLLLLLPRLIPPTVVAMPYSQAMLLLGLHDTRLALVLAHAALLLPWAFLILYGAFHVIPAELFEAATLDGCSEPRLIRAIVIPLSVGALLAAWTLCFALSWNEYPFAILNAGSRVPTATVAVALLFTKDGIEFDFVGSHLLLTLLPPMLLALAARGVVTRALSLGALEDPAALPQGKQTPPAP